MNLYFVLALALGITSPTVQPRVTNAVAVTRGPLQRIAVQFAVRSSQFAERRTNREPRTANCELGDAPLTGASTPRAPAFRC